MKIGMILDAPFPPDPRVENEAIHLIKNKHQVFLFCLDYTHKLPEKENLSGIEVHRYQPAGFVYKLSALAYSAPIYHRLLKKKIVDFILKTRVDTLHIHDIAIARVVIEIGKQYGIPTVLDLHENRPEIMKFYPHVQNFPGNLLIKPKVWEKYESKYIREADQVVVVTREAKEYYLDKLHVPTQKFKVVPNTVRREFYTSPYIDPDILKKYKNYFTLLYIGETGLRRGLQTVIKSIQLLIDDIPAIRLIIVGKSRTDDILRKQIFDSGLELYIDQVGWQNFETFQSYIAASKIGISPIHQNVHHNTTYANKLFQYLSMGKPILVSDCLAQANLVNEYQCGLVHRDQDPHDFAEKVKELYFNNILYQQCANNARAAIENNLGWEIQSRELTQLYEEMSMSHNPSSEKNKNSELDRNSKNQLIFHDIHS
jgi:glycosyltransferase involved in cell wall biosynthesis